MHSKSDNLEVVIYDKADESDQRTFFLSPLFRYQIGLETSVNGKDLIFDCIHLLYDKYHKINLNRGQFIMKILLI